MAEPKIINDPMYMLIREDKIEEFNKRLAEGKTCNFQGCDFRNLDLRKINADGLNFVDAYFRNADLRGVDLRKATIEGASLANAKISGTYFPNCISPQEIMMSVTYGTRLRTNHNQTP